MWNFISSAIGALAQNANTQNAINANKESQAENREWNLNLAKMQNQWSIDQWNRENSYNSPAAYRARLKAAGMNPDLAYRDWSIRCQSCYNIRTGFSTC